MNSKARDSISVLFVPGIWKVRDWITRDNGIGGELGTGRNQVKKIRVIPDLSHIMC